MTSRVKRVLLPSGLALLAIAALPWVLRRAGAAQQALEVASAPANPGWQATIAGPDEPGERIVISGQV